MSQDPSRSTEAKIKDILSIRSYCHLASVNYASPGVFELLKASESFSKTFVI